MSKHSIIIIVLLIFCMLFFGFSIFAQTNQWTWINGIYGSFGVADTNTNPGSMRGGVNWTDTAENFPT